ncbi:MAG TPA: hypothetical protein PKY77_22710 [Phycisphaerae bacterium]|nr:hypothetical protein [Phycisphaerae bacterium]HSA27717.1 hypothetical protein [Phycisphaerae bacterium]
MVGKRKLLADDSCDEVMLVGLLHALRQGGYDLVHAIVDLDNGVEMGHSNGREKVGIEVDQDEPATFESETLGELHEEAK